MKIGMVLDQSIRKLENLLSLIGILMLLIMMFLGSVDVIGRYVFNRPITGAIEASQILLAGIVFLGWGYVQATRSHITLDYFFRRYPPAIQKIVEIGVLTLTLIFFGLIVWQSTLIVIQDFMQDRIIETILIPSWPFKLLLPFGALILCLECISQIIHLLHGMTKKGGH